MTVIAVGMYVAGIHAFRVVADELEASLPDHGRLWAERLAQVYESGEGWGELGEAIAGFPTSSVWAPWDDTWLPMVAVTDAEGAVLYSNLPLGETPGNLRAVLASQMATPIESDGKVVGYVVMPFLPPGLAGDSSIPWEKGARRYEFLWGALRRFFAMEAIVILVGLLVGATLSRRISRPVRDLTDATARIADGDLAARVDGQPPGELGELSVSFNAMATELERSDQLRRNMTADVAHELRTPLSVIRGKLEGILDGVYPATEEHIAPVLASTEVLTQLVEDLRLLALAEARQLSLDLRPVDIGPLIRDAHVNFGPLAEDRGIALVLDVDDGAPQVQGDRQRLSQVLSNLITNAIRHTPEGGAVTMRSVATERSVVVEVADTGVGIPSDDVEHVFERFWRGDRSRSRESGGSGLGLAIAREMVLLHGATIEAESEAGQGTTFRVIFPAHNRATHD